MNMFVPKVKIKLGTIAFNALLRNLIHDSFYRRDLLKRIWTEYTGDNKFKIDHDKFIPYRQLTGIVNVDVFLYEMIYYHLLKKYKTLTRGRLLGLDISLLTKKKLDPISLVQQYKLAECDLTPMFNFISQYFGRDIKKNSLEINSITLDRFLTVINTFEQAELITKYQHDLTPEDIFIKGLINYSVKDKVLSKISYQYRHNRYYKPCRKIKLPNNKIIKEYITSKSYILEVYKVQLMMKYKSITAAARALFGLNSRNIEDIFNYKTFISSEVIERLQGNIFTPEEHENIASMINKIENYIIDGFICEHSKEKLL